MDNSKKTKSPSLLQEEIQPLTVSTASSVNNNRPYSTQTTSTATANPFATSESTPVYNKDVFVSGTLLDEEYGVYEDYVYRHSEKVQRLFITKVYGILLAQIILSTVLVIVNISVPALKGFSMNYPFTPIILLFFSIIVLLGLFISLRYYPLNFLFLTLWTFLNAQAVGMVCAIYQVEEVVLALVTTGIVVAVLTAFTWISKVNVSHWSSYLTVALVSLMVLSFGTLIFSLVFHIGVWWRFLLAGLGSLIFCAFIVYDTSRIMYTSKYNEHIPAAIQLYLDVMNLFLNILSMIGLRRQAATSS